MAENAWFTVEDMRKIDCRVRAVYLHGRKMA
jgi:hypothetical protein